MPHHRPSRILALATLAAVAAALVAAPSQAATSRSSTTTADQRRDSLVAPSAAEPALGRLGGANRYATAVAISSSIWPDGAAEGKHVYVASGENFPDALAGGPAAATQGEPLLLVPRTGTLPTVVSTELKRLKPAFITIFGGTGAVSAGMATQLKALASSKEVYREAGVDRYQTAMYLARYATTWVGNTPNYPDVVYVANATPYADALSGGAAAALDGAPLLLTPRAQLNDWTQGALAEIKPAKIIALGGAGAISTAAFNQLKTYAPSVVRIGGVDRYDTSARLSKAAFPVATDASEVFLTNGLSYPDALAATPAVGLLGDVSLLLTRPTCVPAKPYAEVNRIQPDFITAIGGKAAVSDDTLSGRPC
jgi:putative cell wall-binding protein